MSNGGVGKDYGWAGEKMQKLLDTTGADEIMFTAQIFDHEARLKSFQIAAHVASKLIS